MSYGDILFYRGNGSLASRVIELRTGGPFVHVEVDIGGDSAIGALTSGVSRHTLVPLTESTDVFAVSRYASPGGLHRAVSWLAVQVGAPYGWVDILDAGLPSWWHVLLVGRRAFDCSHLAAQYLITAGLGDLLGTFASTPQAISPNDLARLLHVPMSASKRVAVPAA